MYCLACLRLQNKTTTNKTKTKKVILFFLHFLFDDRGLTETRFYPGPAHLSLESTGVLAEPEQKRSTSTAELYCVCFMWVFSARVSSCIVCATVRVGLSNTKESSQAVIRPRSDDADQLAIVQAQQPSQIEAMQAELASMKAIIGKLASMRVWPVSYTHLRAHET